MKSLARDGDRAGRLRRAVVIAIGIGGESVILTPGRLSPWSDTIVEARSLGRRVVAQIAANGPVECDESENCCVFGRERVFGRDHRTFRDRRRRRR